MPHNELSSSSGGTVKIIGDITYSMLLFYRKPLLVTVLPLVTNLASVIQIYLHCCGPFALWLWNSSHCVSRTPFLLFFSSHPLSIPGDFVVLRFLWRPVCREGSWSLFLSILPCLYSQCESRLISEIPGDRDFSKNPDDRFLLRHFQWIRHTLSVLLDRRFSPP